MSEASATRRRVGGSGLAVLSAITGVISYTDGLDVVRLVGIAGKVAYLVPLVPDLMIVTSSMTLIEAARERQRRPFLAMLALAAGIGWTVAMNVAAGYRHGPGGALILGAVPVAFVLTFETLTGLIKRGRDASAAQGAATTGHCPHGVAGTAEEAVVLAHRHARDCLLEPVSFRQLEARFGVRRDRVSELVRASTNGSGPDA